MKRIALFVLTNFLVVLTLVIATTIFGIGDYLTSQGIDFNALLTLSLFIGFSGSLISLLMSKQSAKSMMGVKVINPKGSMTPFEEDLLNKVYALSRKAGITVMPEVGIYNSPDVNAFATGPSKNKALVAVSSGLLQNLDPDAVEGVLGHEVAHVANGDMVTMTLIQGVINTFVVFMSRALAFVASRFVKEEMAHLVHYLTIIVLQVFFGFLGSIAVMAFSRHREFAADEGGAHLAGREKMIKALQQLRSGVSIKQADDSLQTLKINGGKGKLVRLLSSHPDLDERIRRLRA